MSKNRERRCRRIKGDTQQKQLLLFLKGGESVVLRKKSGLEGGTEGKKREGEAGVDNFFSWFYYWGFFFLGPDSRPSPLSDPFSRVCRRAVWDTCQCKKMWSVGFIFFLFPPPLSSQHLPLLTTHSTKLKAQRSTQQSKCLFLDNLGTWVCWVRYLRSRLRWWPATLSTLV